MLYYNDRLIHSVGKNLVEHGDKIDTSTKEEIQRAIDEAKKLESATDVETIKAQSLALSNAAMKIGQAMYKSDGTSNSDNAKKDEDKPEDVQYEEKEKK